MKRRCICILSIVTLLLLSACSARKDSMEKLRDVEFTVVKPSDVPKELAGLIEENQKDVFQLTYADKGYLYMARGYGEQETSGYSVAVSKCYETEDVICVETGLIGPAKGEEIIEESTYPYVVAKIEYTEKNVVFE